jgi:hypothetical protein
MDANTEKPSSLPQKCALSFSCLHRSFASSKLLVSSPLLPIESSDTPQPSLWHPGPCCPQTQSPQKRVHHIHTML